MRKMIALLIACVLLGSLAGCGGKKDVTKLPHNPKISLNDSVDTVLEKDDLVVGDTEQLGTYYEKADGSKVLIDGYQFTVGYTANIDHVMGLVKYVADYKDDDMYDELKEFLTDFYGSPIKNPETQWEKALAWEIESDVCVYDVLFGITFDGKLTLLISSNYAK